VEKEVLEAARAGWTARAIYEEKKTLLKLSYWQFARYLRSSQIEPAPLGSRHRALRAPSQAERTEPGKGLGTAPGENEERSRGSRESPDFDRFAIGALNERSELI
jgi:hypothetical protein